MPKILVVDDEEPNRIALERTLAREGHPVVVAASARQGLDHLREGDVGVVITDLKMPGMDGMEFLKLCRTFSPDTQVILVTAYGTVEHAVEAMKGGACDFITKPLRRAEVVAATTRAGEKYALLAENRRLREQLTRGPGQEMIGSSAAMKSLLEEAAQVAPSRATVLITGESGTGKGQLARWIHSNCGRSGRMVTVNCGAIPENLLESELFGYEPGAFTGASARKEGRFDLATGGTLFLDEVTELSPSLQVKLLRVLQEGEYERVGGTRTLHADVRVLAGTNRDPVAAVQDGKLRADLYYRLNVIGLHVPPLRERREDIALLARHFAALHARRNGREIEGIDPAALAALESYPWPGNVRELENALERAVVLPKGETLRIADLPAPIRAAAGAGEPGTWLSFAVGTPLREVERRMIEETLRYYDGDRLKAASILGIAARTIYRREAEWRGEAEVED